MHTVKWWLVLSCVAGCSGSATPGEDLGDPVGETSAELVSDNRISLNRISLNRISLNRISLNRISLNRISLNRISLNRISLNRIALNGIAAGDLIATEEGRELLHYVIECALPEGTTLVGGHGGVEYEFEGAIGLAPSWVSRRLDGEDQRWVSACLLARVNAHDVSVQISLRGPHRALRANDHEMATFTLEEGAFWGNVFTGADDFNACRGADQAAGESGDLEDRDCTEPDPTRPGTTACGFEYAGACAGPGRRGACRGYDGERMYYERCSADGERRHREVITVFVKP
jgi:hypothetical protein